MICNHCVDGSRNNHRRLSRDLRRPVLRRPAWRFSASLHKGTNRRVMTMTIDCYVMSKIVLYMIICAVPTGLSFCSAWTTASMTTTLRGSSRRCTSTATSLSILRLPTFPTRRQRPSRTTPASSTSCDESPIQSSARRQNASSQPSSDYIFSYVEVIVNTNAKGVNDGIVEVAKQVFASAQARSAQQHSDSSTSSSLIKFNVHITSTQHEARRVVKTLVVEQQQRKQQQGSKDFHSQSQIHKSSRTLVIPVGGDGTITNVLQWMWDATHHHHDGHDEETEFPFTLAYVAMGTGNALGSVVGCAANQWHTSVRTQRKGPFLQRARRKLGKVCRTPRRRKLDHFRQTLEQIIHVVNEWNDVQGENSRKSLNSDSMYDMVEVPLMRVVTAPTITADDDRSVRQNQDDDEDEQSYFSFFAGVGFDSLMLQDYQDQQTWRKATMLNNGIADSILSGVPGYTIALLTRTLPKCLPPPLGRRAHLMRVQISTQQPLQTSWVDHRRGDFLRPVLDNVNHDDAATQEGGDNDKNNVILYEGKAGIVASSTVPFYGGGLRLFPFARMAGNSKMHLRVGRIHPFRGVVNIPKIFEGSYRDKRDGAFGCLDFIGPSFSIRILNDDDHDEQDEQKSKVYPVQHSGESVGRATNIKMEIARKNEASSMPPIQFLTLLPPRPIYEEETFI